MKMHTYATKIGLITLFEDNDRIVKIEYGHMSNTDDIETKLMVFVRGEIDQYLDGKLIEFSFPFEISGTEFEKKVLWAMKTISYGEKWSYKKLAEKAGYPNAFRAVGTVCKNNKLPLLFPCHRVIKSNGDIGNYNGGEETKKALLELEKIIK